MMPLTGVLAAILLLLSSAACAQQGISAGMCATLPMHTCYACSFNYVYLVYRQQT
jgi:hypothetical protein